MQTDTNAGSRIAPLYNREHAGQNLAVVLVEPRIPQNFGNISRLCACTGLDLILVGDLGFHLSDYNVKRAGMDYIEDVTVKRYADLPDVIKDYPHWQVAFLDSHWPQAHTQIPFTNTATLLVFGSETMGLPKALLKKHPDNCYTIPMSDSHRSLNLSTSVSIVVYEGLRHISSW